MNFDDICLEANLAYQFFGPPHVALQVRGMGLVNLYPSHSSVFWYLYKSTVCLTDKLVSFCGVSIRSFIGLVFSWTLGSKILSSEFVDLALDPSFGVIAVG